MTEQITPEYLSFATEHHASDIFIIAGRPLSFKINGKLSISCLNRPGIARFDPFVHTEQFFLQAADNPLCYIFTVSRS